MYVLKASPKERGKDWGLVYMWAGIYENVAFPYAVWPFVHTKSWFTEIFGRVSILLDVIFCVQRWIVRLYFQINFRHNHTSATFHLSSRTVYTRLHKWTSTLPLHWGREASDGISFLHFITLSFQCDTQKWETPSHYQSTPMTSVTKTLQLLTNNYLAKVSLR